jgi:hypothetical protein
MVYAVGNKEHSFSLHSNIQRRDSNIVHTMVQEFLFSAYALDEVIFY